MINLIIALPAEARPLIDRYKLRTRSSVGNFRLYQHNDMALIVSGPGKIAAAAATALLCSQTESNGTAWLNIGIGGHASMDTGSGRLAHSISDQASDKRWYPPQVLDAAIDSCAVISVDTAENRYPQDAIYDMECSGYYPIACRFASGELVQSYKIVSDNREQAATTVTTAQCTQLIADRLDEIDTLVTALITMAQQHKQWHTLPDDLHALRQRWHFTVSQQHQLTELARRWQVMLPDRPLWLDSFASERSASGVLQGLLQHLNTLPARFTEQQDRHV